MPMETTEADVVIVGGAYAGLAAGLQLGRARRSTVIIDDNRPRNRFASHAHGVLAQDGRPGREILAQARTQVAAYPTVRFRPGEAVQARRLDDGFEIALADGGVARGRRLILAHGVEDVLPDLAGVKERWGVTALHCPWCHGYEVDRGPIGVLWRGSLTPHYAQIVAEWGQVTLFMGPDDSLSDQDAAALARRGVAIERTPLRALEGPGSALDGARLADGRLIPLKAIFVGAQLRQANRLAEALGCEMTETPIGTVVAVDGQQQTSQPGVFAAGDMARAASNITWAVADGMTAAHGAFRSLLEAEIAA